MYFLILMALMVAPQDSEKKIAMRDLPPAVQQAVKEASKGYTLRGLTKEVENDQTKYEAELRAGGRTRDVTFDPEGKIISVEQETDLASIPAPAREAIQKALVGGKLAILETVSEKGATFYEAHIRRGKKMEEVIVDAAGNPYRP